MYFMQLSTDVSSYISQLSCSLKGRINEFFYNACYTYIILCCIHRSIATTALKELNACQLLIPIKFYPTLLNGIAEQRLASLKLGRNHTNSTYGALAESKVIPGIYLYTRCIHTPYRFVRTAYVHFPKSQATSGKKAYIYRIYA